METSRLVELESDRYLVGEPPQHVPLLSLREGRVVLANLLGAGELVAVGGAHSVVEPVQLLRSAGRALAPSVAAAVTVGHA